MGLFDFIFIFLIICLVVFAGFLFYDRVPISFEKSKSANFTSETPTNVVYSKSEQFYPNMRFPDKIITYSISDSCGIKRTSDALSAIDILEEKTILSFEPSSEGEITISCSNIAPQSDDESKVIAGEGGPDKILNLSSFYLIESGKVALYKKEDCNTPNVATHEILHALGFDHNDNPKSIMYPVSDCSQTIDESIIDDIASLYSIPSRADLLIESATLTKDSIYLNLNITISNLGFKDTTNSKLIISSNGEEIKRFDLNNIDVGIKKKLTIENLKTPRNTKTIDLLVEYLEEELSKENNKATITL